MVQQSLGIKKAGFKNYKNLTNFRQVVESPKSWNLMDFSPKKYNPSAKTLYTVDLSNITFNCLCVDSPNYFTYTPFYFKGAYIKYVGGTGGARGGGFYKFFKKIFVAQLTIDLNFNLNLNFSKNT